MTMNILVIFCCIVAVCNAIPLTDSTKEVYTSKFDSNGPQPVDEVIAIPNDSDEIPSKRVARHYGFGGVSVGVAVPVVVPSYGYGGGYPYYGGGYGGYGGYGGGYGGYGGYGGGYGGYGGYGGGYGGYGGYGRGYGHHHHHHHRHWR